MHVLHIKEVSDLILSLYGTPSFNLSLGFMSSMQLSRLIFWLIVSCIAFVNSWMFVLNWVVWHEQQMKIGPNNVLSRNAFNRWSAVSQNLWGFITEVSWFIQMPAWVWYHNHKMGCWHEKYYLVINTDAGMTLINHHLFQMLASLLKS